jgi:hypothetical protein
MKDYPEIKHYVTALELKVEVYERWLKELAKTNPKAVHVLIIAAKVSGIPAK